MAMDTSEIGTLKQQQQLLVPGFPSSRRRPLRSRTADTFFRILSLCYSHSSHTPLHSDKGDTHIGSATKDDVSLNCTDIIPSLCQEEMSMDETRVVLDTLEGGLCNEHVESAECDHKVDTDHLKLFDSKSQDNHDMMFSSPHSSTDKDVEEGEISGEFIDLMPENDAQFVDNTVSEREKYIGLEPGLRNDNKLMPLLTDTVEDVNKDDMEGAVNRRTRILVDYSEIAVHGKSRESAKQVPVEHVLPLQSMLKNSATKSQDLAYLVKDGNAQNNRKRQGSHTAEDTTNKKVKKSVDPTPCPETSRLLEHLEDTSLEEVDASANKDASNEKKKKQVSTKERKAKKKRNERIKRAEKNRKLGVKRLKLQPVIREKIVTYCRHYMNGRCYEGDKCKFSHDTIPLTKSMPCCHFARHACMKGDNCPFDHQLFKYPCNNLSLNGFCSRGSDCMFSHKAPPTSPLNVSNESKPEQKPPSNSGSVKVDTKSCSIPKFVTSNTERNVVDTTPKLSVQPPKGISFLPREKFPPEPRLSPKVNADVKESTKTPPVIQDSKEITKTCPAIPRGINFLSFGKKPGLDHSNVGSFIKMSNGTGRSQLSNLEGEDSKSEPKVDAVKVDLPTDRPNTSQKLMPMLPFMSSTSQKALQSALAFASKFESGVKTNRPGSLVPKQ